MSGKHNDINRMSFPQAKRVGNPSSTDRFRTSRNDKLSGTIIVMYKKLKGLREQKGVTLVEVMIALVVLLLVMMGLLQAALLSIDHNVRNVMRDEAISVAAERLSELRNTPFDHADLAATNCGAPVLVQRNIRNMTVQYNVCDVIRNLELPPNPINTKEVQVVVGWNHKNENPPQGPTNREYQHSVTTLRRR